MIILEVNLDIAGQTKSSTKEYEKYTRTSV